VCIGLAVLTAGCGAIGLRADSAETGQQSGVQSGDDAGGSDLAAQATAAGPGSGASEGGFDAGGLSTQPTPEGPDQRAVIKEGNVTLEVSNFSTARGDIEALAAEQGGYVSDSSLDRHERHNQTWHTGRLVLRVPADNFSATRAGVERQGTVERVDVRTRDVTDQLVDINARLENLERERDRLREFMDEANDTESLLAVEQRLSTVQGEIERLEAQRRSLLDRVAYSTLVVDLHEPRPEPSDDEDGGRSLVGVFVGSVTDVAAAGQWLLYAVVALVPWAVAFGLPVGLVAVLVRRRGLSLSLPGLRSRPDDGRDEEE